MLSLLIHGARGSVPATGKKFSKYGGNTTCFEIETEDSQIFVDAGTGFGSSGAGTGFGGGAAKPFGNGGFGRHRF